MLNNPDWEWSVSARIGPGQPPRNHTYYIFSACERTYAIMEGALHWERVKAVFAYWRYWHPWKLLFMYLSLCFSRRNKVSSSSFNFWASSAISSPQEANIVYENLLTYKKGKWKWGRTPLLSSELGGNLLPVIHRSKHAILISPLAQRSMMLPVSLFCL